MNRKIVFLIFLLLFSILIISIAIILVSNRENSSNPKLLIEDTDELIRLSTQKDTPKSIRLIAERLDDKRLSEEKKYQSLIDIVEYLSSLYNETHTPGIRNYAQKDLKAYGAKRFPRQFSSTDFDITCADPYCGEKIDSLMDDIVKDIKQIKMPQANKDTILYNLELANYIPITNMAEKKTGFSLSITQLKELGLKEASISAEKIKKYFENKYKTDL